jgi:hypothetical protein
MGVNTVVKNIKVPSVKNWFFIPFAIFTIICLISGYLILKSSYKNGGYSYYPSECRREAETACGSVEAYDCINNYLKENCEDKKEILSVGTLVAIHILFSLLIGGSLAFSLYKLVLYIKNPKLAAGAFILKSIF